MNTEFLAAYKPANDKFTTFEEVDTIKRELGLDGLDKYQLTDVRNNVVLFYSERMHESEAAGKRDEAYDLMTSMQSVTAAIDHLKLSAGASVCEL